MLMRQVNLIDDEGQMMTTWVDSSHAIVGHRFDLDLGHGQRSPVYTVQHVWQTQREATDIHERQIDQRAFGRSIR